MRPLSIKVRITLWYTGLIVFILCIVLGSIWFSSDKLLLLEMQRELEDEVYDAVEKIRYIDGVLAVDNMQFFDDGIHISLHGSETMIAGQLPYGFPGAVPFIPERLQTIRTQQHAWLVYDTRVAGKQPDPLWIRGVMSMNAAYEIQTQILTVCLLLFPFLVLLAGYGGWLITKSAFQPVDLIRRTAEDIEKSGDLSKRIQLTGGRDEVYELAQTFDYMLERLEQSFKTERQFTSDASHELRTPVSVIVSHAEYGLSQKERPGEMAAVLQIIRQQAERINELISSLLFLARADHREEKMEFEQINLSELAEMVVEEMQPLAQDKQILLFAEIEPDLILFADQTSLMRLLLNLLQNAVRYGRENGWVRLTLRKTAAGIEGSVEDNGIGIAAENIGKIWKRFYREDPARRHDGGTGTGLGLPMVKWIIEQHGGMIQVESRQGQGSAFRFRLPLDGRRIK